MADGIAIGINTFRLQKELRGSLRALEGTLDKTVEAISSLCETRDPYTAGHQRRVASLGSAIAAEMGLSIGQIKAIQRKN